MAALELALFLGVASAVMLNGVELARYYYSRMELENAAQMAVQNVFRVCDKQDELPATLKCSERAGAITSAFQSTTLGAAVTLQAGSPSEAYFCVNSAGTLTQVATVNETKPANCSSVGNSAGKPSLYFRISAQYQFVPIFDGITVGSALPAVIETSTMARLS